MSVTLYECLMGHAISDKPGVCVECEGELVPVEYVPVKKPSELHKSELLYVDDDGYVSFDDFQDIGGPGGVWTLHTTGWEVYVHGDDEKPIFQVGDITFPTDDDLSEGAAAYEKWLERNPHAKKQANSGS